MKPLSHHLLDIRATILPITLLKVTQAFREMNAGETIEILVADPDTRQDLFKVLSPSLYELMEMGEEKSFFRILLKKRGEKEARPL